MRFHQLKETLRSSLWFIPSLTVVAAILVSTGMVALDGWLFGTETQLMFSFTGSAEAARNILSVIASSMITLTALVFTILIVVFQLTSTQFSPRVMRTFLRDRDSQWTLASFVGTFTYSLLVLRAVRSAVENDPEFVPGLSVTGAFVLVILSLGVFVTYINHIAQSIRAINIITSVGSETRGMIDRLYPGEMTKDEQPRISLPEPEEKQVVHSPGSGVLLSFDAKDLARKAAKHDWIIKLVPSVGDFVPEGAPLLEVWGETDDMSSSELLNELQFGQERTMTQDVAFGFRQLVDMAEKALSPGINDPTTAVQCLDQIHDLLRRLARRRFPAGVVTDEEGNPRLVHPTMEWEGYVALAVDEIRHYGEGSIQIARRMRAMLEDLQRMAPASRLEAVEQRLKLLDASIQRSFPDLEDRESAEEPDQQGIGS